MIINNGLTIVGQSSSEFEVFNSTELSNISPKLCRILRNHEYGTSFYGATQLDQRQISDNWAHDKSISDLFKNAFKIDLGDGIVLHILPRKVVDWYDFIKHAPPYSIAMDGFVFGRPRFDPAGPFLNSNHHEEVDRLGTRCTAAQINMYIQQGLMESFTCNGQIKINVFINDSDQDTCTAIWLLKNYASCGQAVINRLITAEDFLDSSAGAYPYRANSKIMKQLNWIYEPYMLARVNGRIPTMGAPELSNMITAVYERITQYSLGCAKELDLDTRFKVIGGGTSWKLVEELGIAARTGIYNSGIKAFVAARANPNGTYTYSIGKLSQFIKFPIQELYSILNQAEGLVDGSPNSWGGGDIIGGSPRMTGSKLTPKQVEAIINQYLWSKNMV